MASSTVQGNLTFDSGLPAAGITTRIYNIGFGGQEIKLGETKSDAQGNYSIAYSPNPLGVAATPVNLQVRVVDSTGNEVTISNTKFNALPQETLNLVVPSRVQPLAPEFQRLSADMATHIGGVAALGNAQEGDARQDLTLLNQSTDWDARLVSLAATAAQQTGATGLGQDVLYALYRYGLPTDPQHLAMVPSATVQAALTKANQAGIVGLTPQQVTAAGTAFQAFVTKTRLGMIAPGAVSSFGDLLPPPSVAGASQFADLFFSNPSGGADFWNQAAKLGIANLEAFRVQGKLLYLTFNNAPLTQRLHEDIGSLPNLSQLAEKDYHLPATWNTVLTALAGSGGDAALQKLIPSFYEGATADRVAAYSGDLARKIRVSFPEHVVAREIDKNNLAVNADNKANVSAFLRAAAPLGYQLGRTPLNAFLKSSTNLPAMSAASTETLKVLERMYRVTPSFESLQATLKLGFTSAREIATYTKDEFMSKYANSFPSSVEASLVYGRAQMISAVTLNAVAMTKQLDTGVPVYALSGTASATNDARQSAKSAIVQQFPSMATLFGNMDFCQCEDCRSVLSPAAYFVDLLEFLKYKSAPTKALNAAGYTPLDVLIGKDTTVPGRRPDLGALPLTCENTNTAMPYIDLVNEIFEYYIANSHLDGGAAYDTGTASTADLTAEPQHILPKVYNDTLRNAVYPLNLPFDLWIETVRGFLNYFKIPLSRLLEVFRTADQLELFTDASNQPYYRAQILAESLGLSPAEYGVLTVIDPSSQKPSVQNWYKLYGYNDEPTALNELKSAKTLSHRLGLTYQELTDLVTTGFLNPALCPLIFQFRRFGIELGDAFSYTGQPGYPAMTAQVKTAFEAQLTAVQGRYSAQNPSSTFKAIPWLTSLLPANYSKKVLVLADPNGGCDFSGTTLRYADGSPATALDFLRFNLFARLWKKLGWTLDEVDRALPLFFPANLPPWGDPNFAAAFSSSWKTALVYLAHLDELNTRLAPALGRVALLPLWTSVPAQGDSPLYGQLFLVPGVLNNDWAFDDPNGQFPAPLSDLVAPLNLLSAHQTTVQGVLGLSADEITAILADAGSAVSSVAIVVNGNSVNVPSFTLTNVSICYRYSALAKCLQLSVSDLIALKAMSGVNPFQPLSGNPIATLADDILYNQTLSFVNQVAAVKNSGFTIEDLKYLLRQQVDPVGKYRSDPNALMSLVRTLANGLQQIEVQNVPLGQTLSRKLALDTLSANLSGKPDLTEALVTDATLLSDPTNPGKSLLETFLAIGQRGVNASYYTSTNGAGSPSASGVAATTDTTDPTNNQPGTASANFEGYLQVPTDGSYRLFAELGDTGAAASFKLDSPDPSALFHNPIIDPSQKATSPGAEVSQSVQLRGGVAYHFTLDFSNLGVHGASLLIQGETVAKGPLNQIVLYPEQSIANFTRARTLLSKALQIVQAFELDTREVSYFAANAVQFNNFNLSGLPAQPSDDSLPNAVKLFSQFLALADYADLRKGPAGGSDGLVNVFQAATQTAPQEPNTPWTILANLTRRDPQVVRDVAAALGPDPHFTGNTGIRRIWDALQLAQTSGIPVGALSTSTLIVSRKPPASPTPDQIAANFKNAVQAQYTKAQWRPIAQSIFDKLRQKKRDALVAYLVQALSLETSNQLFEYFLVDPGMEPVVQTSRLRLAMSSVQTFIQRCLLNLENANLNPALNVAASAIDADSWEWMKRYRVWQANREIFLYPENWMEPELRPDKTDLFQALESALLQGDVTSDLVEDAFLTYLKGLDTRARFDIVASYLDQNIASPDRTTLHVLGRTYCHPHKYFYRTHSTDGWSAWQAVTPDIESDHIALAVWKGRLCVFWVTFISTPEAPGSSTAIPNDGLVTSLHFSDLAANINAAKATPKMKVQLHWSEYFQGKWSNRISSDINKYDSVQVPDGFDPKSVYIHVSKEVDSEGSEGALRVHLDFPDVLIPWIFTVALPIGQTMALALRPASGIWGHKVNVGGGHSFRVTSKNCNPDFGSQYWQPDPFMPYSATDVDASAHSGSSTLDAIFESQISSDSSGTTETEHILQSVNNYELLTCANPVAPSALLDANEPLYWQAGGLVSPFFYKDTAHLSTSTELTFFVQPSLTETTVGGWEGWAVYPPLAAQNWANVNVLDEIAVSPQVPVAGPISGVTADPVYSVFSVRSAVDWATSPKTAISYGNAWIGQKGAINVASASSGSPSVTGRLGSGQASSAAKGLIVSRGLNLVGKQGVNLNQLRLLKTT